MQKRKNINEERGIPSRPKVVCESKVPLLTSHVGPNPRSKHASLSLTASLAALRAGNEREARVIKRNRNQSNPPKKEYKKISNQQKKKQKKSKKFANISPSWKNLAY